MYAPCDYWVLLLASYAFPAGLGKIKYFSCVIFQYLMSEQQHTVTNLRQKDIKLLKLILEPSPHSHLQCFKIPCGMLMQSCVTISQVWKLLPLLMSANESLAPSHLL